MRLSVAIPLFAFAAAIASAERIFSPTLQASAFADTEVSTNIAITPFTGGRSFSVMLSLDATASNNVEVVVGNDAAPPDGVLSPAEESLRFGWDCGNWFLDAPCLTNHLEIAPANTDVRKTLTLNLGIRPNGTLREAAMLDGDTPLAIETTPAAHAPFWNMLRVTVRGADAPMESLSVRNAPDGTQLIFR